MTQPMRGLTALVSAVVCGCLLVGTTTVASVDRDLDKAKRADQAQNLKKVNQTPAREQQAAKQQGGSILSKPKQQISKPHITTVKQRPVTTKPPFTGHPTPPNPDVIRQGGDDILSATTISSIPFADAGTTSGYTDDYDEICPYDAPGSADVVYRYTPASSTVIDIDLCPSGYDTKVYVYENAAGNLVACNDDADDCALLYRSQLIGVPLTGGNTYYIVVDGYGGDDGAYDITITGNVECIVDCPVNHEEEGEACGDSTNDGCNVSIPSYGEVKCGDTICGTAWADGDLRDTDWFLKTISDDTTFTWSGTAEFDFALIIADLNAGCGGVSVIESGTADACDTATISATLGAGTYVFFIAPSVFSGYTCAGGPWNYTVWLDCAEPPPGPANNDCADAIAIGDVTDLAFSTTGAVTDGGPVCVSFGFDQVYADIWYCYTATCDGIATASLCNSDYDTKMAVYDGCTCPAVDMIGCNDDACGDDGLKSEVVFPVVAGNTYLIRIGGYDGESGDGLLSISCGAAAENDNCSDVTPQSLPAVFVGDNTGATSDCGLTAPDAETWAAFTISDCSNVTVEYCGTDPLHETIYVVLFEECPCEDGSYIFADDYNFDDCGDGNATMHFNLLPAGTYYYAILSSAVDGSVGPYTVSISGVPCPAGYCPAQGGVCDEYISNVTVGSINNSSDCDNYADYTSLSTTMDIGTGYPITVENGFPYSSDQCGIWVDWNQDEDFNDMDETITVSGTPGPGDYTATITPPAGALAGPTRMRVRITYTGAVSPCGTTTYGEVEDYTITVSGGPVGADLIISPDTIKAFMAFTIDPSYATLHLGNEFAPGYDVNDINLSTLELNGLPVSSATVLPGYAGFTGPVLEIKQELNAFLFPEYQMYIGTTPQTADVTGEMNDATAFSTTSETFYYTGHPAGDLRRDGRINVLDLNFLIAYMFAGGETPTPVLLADLNASHTVNVQDLNYMIAFLFAGGPAPVQP